MPRGIYDRKAKKQSTVKKKAAKKKAAKKKDAKVSTYDSFVQNASKRVLRDVVEMSPLNMGQNGKKKRTTKEEIIDTLSKFHVQYDDKDGHIAIRSTQMLDRFTITELLDNGVQIMNSRKDEIGTYIALYY